MGATVSCITCLDGVEVLESVKALPGGSKQLLPVTCLEVLDCVLRSSPVGAEQLLPVTCLDATTRRRNVRSFL